MLPFSCQNRKKYFSAPRKEWFETMSINLNKPIRGVSLDLGWTLLCPPSGDWFFSDFARRFFREELLRSLPAERVEAAMVKAERHLNVNHHLAVTMDAEYGQFLRYYTILSEELPELGVTPRQLEEITRDKVYNLDNYALFPGTLNTLETLRGKYRLCIISDTWPSIEPVMEKFGLKPYFDGITYSYQVGVYKPDPKMFRHALAQLGLPAGETVFVDDTPGNLRGARELGVQPILIREKPGPASAADMASIDCIDDLPALLEA